MRTDWMPLAYEQANDGDWTLFAENVHPDYTHQVPAVGLHYTTRDEAIEGLRQRYADNHMRQTVHAVTQHGDFVIVQVDVVSDFYPQPTSVVHVYRLEGNKFAEFLGAYPPPHVVPQP